ncbi:hypothetical protein ACLOJK_032933 [Asimina triloba]
MSSFRRFDQMSKNKTVDVGTLKAARAMNFHIVPGVHRHCLQQPHYVATSESSHALLPFHPSMAWRRLASPHIILISHDDGRLRWNERRKERGGSHGTIASACHVAGRCTQFVRFVCAKKPRIISGANHSRVGSDTDPKSDSSPVYPSQKFYCRREPVPRIQLSRIKIPNYKKRTRTLGLGFPGLLPVYAIENHNKTILPFSSTPLFPFVKGHNCRNSLTDQLPHKQLA